MQVKQKNNSSALLFAVLVLLFWSAAATAFKIALAYYSAFELLFLASSSSFIVLSLIMLLRGKFSELKRVSKNDFLRLLAAGIANPLIYYLILFKAYELLPAQYAQAINFTWPIVLSLAAVFWGREKFHYLRFFALVLSFLGVLLLIFGAKKVPGGINFRGVLLAFASTVFWAFYWMINKSLKCEALIALWISFAVSTAILVFLALFYFRPDSLSLPGLAAAIYVGLFEMSITFLLWLQALRRSTSTALVSNFIYAVPFLSLLFIRYVLGETIQRTTIAGLFLILCGILLQMLIKNKTADSIE